MSKELYNQQINSMKNYTFFFIGIFFFAEDISCQINTHLSADRACSNYVTVPNSVSTKALTLAINHESVFEIIQGSTTFSIVVGLNMGMVICLIAVICFEKMNRVEV